MIKDLCVHTSNEITSQLVARNMERSTRYLKMVWDTLANEYYSEVHKTSRNFDTIIRHYLPKMIPKLRLNGLYLDLGGGSGKLKELYNDSSSNIIVGDVSLAMMKTKTNSLSPTCYIQMDAFNIPFKANTFNGVFSLLGDSYAIREAFQEVLRILKSNGFFLITLPTKLWAENLRAFFGVKMNETIFTTQEGRLIKVPSFVYDSTGLEKILLSIGFKEVKTGQWRPSDLIPRERFSGDVLVVARKLDVPPEDLPLITYALAYKGHTKQDAIELYWNWPLDKWVDVFYREARKRLEGRSPSDVWLRFVENAGVRIAEFIRKEEHAKAIESVGEAFGWLCCIIGYWSKQRSREGFKILNKLSDIVWHKYPGMCYACADEILEPEVRKEDYYVPCRCLGMRGKTRDKAKAEQNLNLARKKKEKPITLDNWARMIQKIYENAHYELPISSICLHFLEEVGEVAGALIELEDIKEASNKRIRKLEDEIADVFSWIFGLINKIDQTFSTARDYYKDRQIELPPLKASETVARVLETTFKAACSSIYSRYKLDENCLR